MEPTARYGLEFNPFLKNSKEVLFKSSEFNEALFRLDYLAKTRGFGLLTGSPGRGKTTIVRHWASTLNPSLYKVIYTGLSTVTVNDFYRNLASSLGAQASLMMSPLVNTLSGFFPWRTGIIPQNGKFSCHPGRNHTAGSGQKKDACHYHR